MTPRRSTAAVFFVHAAVVGTFAPRIPAIKADLGIGNGELGGALTGFAAGLFAGTRIAAWLGERFGSRRVIRVCLPIFAISLAGPGLAGDLAGLTAALVPFGIVAGLLDVTMNAQAVEVERGHGSPIMSGVHGFWSVGVLVASAIAAGVAAAGVGVRADFIGAAGVLLALSAFAPIGLLPGSRSHHPAPRRNGRPVVAAAVALGVIAFCSFLGEGAAADWSGVYLHEDAGSGAGLAAFAFTAFALGMAAARFCADRLSARFGPVAVVRVGGLVAAAGLGLALALADVPVSLAGFAFMGLGLAPIVPTVFSAAGNLGTGARPLGWVVTMGYVGSVLGPAGIGLVAHGAGLRWALVIPAVLALSAALLSGFVRTAAGAEPAAPRRP